MEREQIIGDKYRVVRELGAGAMGAVYEVEHIYIKKPYALKLINPELAQNPEFKQRALRESQASAAIRHDNIVDVVDFGETEEGAPYIVMEFLEGEPLTDVIAREAPMEPKRALAITAEILKGLVAAHAAGIIHRDIKPDNIMILRGSTPEAPRIKILDFGISKMKSTEEGMTLTRTNTVMGTPFYMSLEQCRGAKDVDGRADVFSVGVILHEMLSGALPYTGDTFAELVVKLVNAERNDIRAEAPWLAPEIVDLVQRATEVDRRKRFSSAAEMLQRVQELLSKPELLQGPPPDPAERERLRAAYRTGSLPPATPPEHATKVAVPKDALQPPGTGTETAEEVRTAPEAEPPSDWPAGESTDVVDGITEQWRPRRHGLVAAGALLGLLLAGVGGWWFLGRTRHGTGRVPAASSRTDRATRTVSTGLDATPPSPPDAGTTGPDAGSGGDARPTRDARPTGARTPGQPGVRRGRQPGRPSHPTRPRRPRRKRRRIKLKTM